MVVSKSLLNFAQKRNDMHRIFLTFGRACLYAIEMMQASLCSRLRAAMSICLCCLAMTVAAINGKLYSSELMASSNVTDILQDGYGFIWIATDHGLSRFDGYRFTNYYHSHRDSTTLPDNYVGCFLSDRDGNLWVGHGKGLCRYDYASERFVRQHLPNGIEPRVNTMVQDNSGNIFIGTAGMGMYVMSNGVLKRHDEFSNGTNDHFFAHLQIDRRGNLWSGNHKDMAYLYMLKNGKMHSCKAFHSEKGEPMAFIDIDGQSVLLVCKKGILRYDYDTGNLTDAGYDLGVAEGDLTLNHAYLDPSGNLYLGSYGHGLLVIGKGEKKARKEPLIENHRQQATPYVSHIMQDKNKNIWLTCYDTGVFLASQQKPSFDNWSLALQDPQFSGRVTAMAPDADGGTWLAVRQGSLYHFSHEGQILSHFSIQPELRSICWERGQRYWLGAGNTLYLFDSATGNIQKKQEFDGIGIGQIISDGNGHIYISVFGKGFYKYDTDNGSLQDFNASVPSTRGRLCNNWVGAMMVDSRQHLWLATATGVSCMNPSDGSFNSLGWNVLLENIACGSLCETKEHDVVIGTDDGLFVYRRATNKTERFPGSELLEDVGISSIVEDEKGDLWVSTSQGIWQYVHQEKRFVNHLNGNGLSTREYISRAVLTLSDGRIAFGQRDGLTLFNPEDIKSGSEYKGKAYLTRFIRDGNPVDFRGNSFVIPYDENSFSMEFSLLDYENTDNISFQYRLNGGQWTSTTKGNNVISFGKMKPGTYHIEVRAESNGTASSEVLKLTVVIRNPWYLSTWAIIAYLLAAAIIAWYLFRSYNKRKLRELDEEKMKFLINATHDIRSPLTLIMGPLAKLKAIVTDDNGKSYIDTIDRNAQRLMLLVNQILDERKIDKNQMQLHCRETNLVEFITGICRLYQYNATQRNITFTFEHDKNHVLAWIDRINFDKVINNLLSNAFKYTYDGGEVKVMLIEREREMEIQVIDNGVGIKDEDKERLFDRFYQGRNADSLGMQGSGIGLNLSRSIVKMHGGQIKAQNRVNGEQGACFIVTIPKGNRHLKPEQIVTDGPAREVLSSGGKMQYRQFRILVVDDDPEIVDYIISELGSKYKFDHSPNGKEALKALLTGKYDLVVSDVMMPEMDGITLLKRIKDNPNISHIPVVLLTSKAEVEYKLEGLKSGADAYIPKPFNMEELHIQIDNLLDNVRRLRGKFSGALQQEDRVDKIEVKGNDDALMDRIMRSVNAHMSDPEYNVDLLASDVGLSRAQLHRKMKEMTGVATGKFLRNLRMEQAARLLKEGKVNISQVADKVGYIDQAHFSTAFKNHFGMSPSEYVERNKEP